MMKNVDKSKPYAYTIGELPLVTWFNESQPMTTLNICQHMGSKLDNGRVQNGCLICPYHGIKHNTKDIIGNSVVFEDKLWWSYQPNNKLPPATPFYNDKNFETIQFNFDINSNVQDFMMNTLDINHFSFVHKNIVGKNIPPINHKYKIYENKITMNYEYIPNENIAIFKNDLHHFTNHQIYHYPHSSAAVFSLNKKDIIVVHTNILPLAPNKSRVFVTVKHNFWKSYFGKIKLEGILRYILHQDQLQMSQQYEDNFLKKTVLLRKLLNNEHHLKHVDRMYKDYEYPDMISTMRLCNYHYK
jgi:phenylpropionate dioxygenase-like ring-hydroxylating dioxygenase large terminal subunit